MAFIFPDAGVSTDMAASSNQFARVTGAPSGMDAAALNAGVGVSGRFTESDLAEELNMVALNVTSTLHVAKYIVKDMAARGSGRILFTASIAGTLPTPYEAVYDATKAFVRSLSQSLREELKDTGVQSPR